ncbi:MAG: hypothetical protein PWQ66_232 [Petrotoga sp.]|nr:hypothetical protein [Petrotoga sp.]
MNVTNTPGGKNIEDICSDSDSGKVKGTVDCRDKEDRVYNRIWLAHQKQQDSSRCIRHEGKEQDFPQKAGNIYRRSSSVRVRLKTNKIQHKSILILRTF